MADERDQAMADTPRILLEESARPLSVSEEIWALLPQSNGNLGAVATCLHAGITERTEIVEAGGAANVGAVGNLLATIAALKDGVIPRGPTVARGSLSSARSFRKQHLNVLTERALEHLDRVIADLAEAASNVQAQEEEERELKTKAGELEDALAAQGGVYVFTYPHYWRYPTAEGTRRTALKIGHTMKDAETRVRQQARLTALPEDPLILRVYRSNSADPRDMERVFHRLVNAADHTRDSTLSGGREWFETSVEFLDTVAQVLGYEIIQAEQDL